MSVWRRDSLATGNGGERYRKQLPERSIGSIETAPALWRRRTFCLSWRAREAQLTLDLDRLRAEPLCRDPFDFVVVEDFVSRAELAPLLADFPHVPGHGSFPVESLNCGPAFSRLVAALTGPALRSAVEEKFELDLSNRPTMLTVRGRSDGKDGRIHTDSESKIITLLLYLNRVWEQPEGRLRLLRSCDDIEDYAREIVPLAGTMLAFRRSARSFHGHRPHIGERRAVQLNWVTKPAVVRREFARHRWSARWKALNRFAHRG
ncbi:MAG: 2OG-Fe(II) oxygenase [Alphaproteobacteria bacterium]|nr:2OG-Fe(II) oxygenase [Alphaproteobacteria bacterium]MBV9373452.1 2OG-Fe(II) oxygenase [Alphaproteobacteria bacterium]